MRINKTIIIILITLVFYGCIDQDFDWKYTTNITYINSTSDTIFVSGIDCDVPNILPTDTVTYKHVQFHSGTSKKDIPSLDNIFPFVNCDFFYGKSGKCEPNTNVVDQHEDRKQTGDFDFEHTFRFTQNRKEMASVCN